MSTSLLFYTLDFSLAVGIIDVQVYHSIAYKIPTCEALETA